MNYIVYVIYNKQRGKIYIGYTSDLDKRLKRHNGILTNNPLAFTSRNKGVWELIYKEYFETRKEAMIRERQLKRYSGRRFVKNFIV